MENKQKKTIKSNIERIEKLTALQEGMYFHHEMNPSDGSYHEQCVLHAKGVVHLDYAQTAMNILAQLHDVLRTAFITLKNGENVQIVLKERNLECTFEKSDKSLDELLNEDIRRGFDLQKDSLLRLRIVEIAEKEYYFIWSFHHIIMDGWCMSIILGDFLRYYNALVKGKDEKTLQEEIQNRIAIMTVLPPDAPARCTWIWRAEPAWRL